MTSDADLDDAVDALIARHTGDRVLLGLCGPPASGKSHAAATIVARATDRHGLGSAVVVPMDGFHLANEVLIELGRRDRKGAPDTFDVDGFIALLDRVRTSGEASVYAPRFYREIEAAVAGAIAIPPTVRLVVVEGNYLLLDDDSWAPVQRRFDEVWYLDVDAAIREQRLIDRHRAGHGAGAEAWVRTVDRPNGERVEATRHRADRIVNPTDMSGGWP
jgi:pantothenate kinase